MKDTLETESQTKIHKAAWAEVNIGQIRKNLEIVRERVGSGVKVCGILKADAYGHGLIGLKDILCKLGILDMTAVGKMSKLKLLFEQSAESDMDTLLLGMADTDEVRELLKKDSRNSKRAIFSVFSRTQFEELDRLGMELGVKIRVHIRIDGWSSGMGIGMEEFLSCEDDLFRAENIRICGLYSHLYCSYSDDRELMQSELERFDRFVKQIGQEHRKQLRVHILNSSLVFAFPEYAYDMVRVGTAMYGLECGDRGVLKPAMRICAEVFDVREIDALAPLSYSKDTKQSGKRRIARIMLGYWDSPLLLTQQDVHIRIRDRLFSLADEVCMDNLCIDVTGADDIEIGDVAVLLGEDGVTVGEILKRNHIHYVHSEWLCMTAGRLEKVYL